MVFSDSAGASHGGRGGIGTSSSTPGQAYGSVEYPQAYGSGSLSSSGGGIIKLTSLISLNVDGIITVEGEHSKRASSGGASGGSILLKTQTFSGNGKITATGGNGNRFGGGAGGGRISVSFYNRTFSGSLLAYGGTSTFGVGGAGTVYTKDFLKNKTHLLVDNNNLGKSLSDDITDIKKDSGRTWVTPEPGTSKISFSDVEIRGHSHLAVITTPPNKPILWDVGGSIGDRTGIMHVRENQQLEMTLKNTDGHQPDLLWGVNVYKKADVKLPENLVIDGIKMIVAGSISGAQNITIGNNGKLILRYV